MYKYCILVILCSFVANVAAINCTVEYTFKTNREFQKEKPCSNDVKFCVCVKGTYQNQPFTVRDCQDTASIIVASFTNQSREISFSCNETANSTVSSNIFYYDYGCTDDRTICSANILHQGNRNITMNSSTNSESRVTIALSSLILSVVYYILK